MDWFLSLQPAPIEYSEFTWITPLGYTVRWARFDDEPDVAQVNYGQDHFYFAWCPELDGCMTDAATATEAMTDLQRECIPLFIESMREYGLTPPPPGVHRTVTR